MLPADEEASGMLGQGEMFEQALEFYQEARYDSAALLFSAIETPEAHLFAGKSYFALSDYPLAKNSLRKLSRNDDPRLYDESRYTLALTAFQTRQFGLSLDILHNIKSRPAYQNLHRDAATLYQQIMGYLTTVQRKMAFMQSEKARVQLDLIRFGLDHMSRFEAIQLFDALQPYFEATNDTNIIGALERRIQSMPTRGNTSFGKAPDGIVYNIGVLLPAAEPGTREWQISRSLYNGYLLAAEEFNRSRNEKKIRLHHMETSDTSLTLEAAMSRLAWKYHADAVIGPLVSEAAYRIRDLAEYYQIPVIPPLANADTLNINNPYLYQVNPTFEARGRAMAAFAVNELELDTLAVITQSNLPVTREAREFRNEAERLGAKIVHYFSENFEERAFEVGHITPYFAGNRTIARTYFEDEDFELIPVEGLYLSVTGGGAGQLIDLILNDLQALRSDVTILGNEEMAHLDFSDARRRYFDIFYSSFFHRDEDNRKVYHFRNNYQSLAGYRPDNFAHLGYDVAHYLFSSIAALENPVRIKQELRHRPAHEGTITQIDFRGSHINHHLHFLYIDDSENVLKYEPEEEVEEVEVEVEVEVEEEEEEEEEASGERDQQGGDRR
ncbi:MAG: ABC transporter substrate-binding protein [Cyclonatronaceae bacterium]